MPPRKSFLIRRARAVVPDEATAARYMHEWEGGALYRDPTAFPMLTSPSIFGNTLPIELEIGSSTGEYLCGLAARDPGTNYLGVEINLKSVQIAVHHAASRGLTNIKFIKAPMQYLYPLLEPGTLRAIYLHFPDPALHPKYRKRRLWGAEFLAHLNRALLDGGTLSIVTDNEALFRELLPLIDRAPGFRRAHPEPYLTTFEPEVKSRYQLYWESHGLSVYRVVLCKMPSPSAHGEA